MPLQRLVGLAVEEADDRVRLNGSSDLRRSGRASQLGGRRYLSEGNLIDRCMHARDQRGQTAGRYMVVRHVAGDHLGNWPDRNGRCLYGIISQGWNPRRSYAGRPQSAHAESLPLDTFYNLRL